MGQFDPQRCWQTGVAGQRWTAINVYAAALFRETTSLFSACEKDLPKERVTSTDNLQASFGWPRPGEQQRNEAVLSQMVFMAEALWENKHARGPRKYTPRGC